MASKTVPIRLVIQEPNQDPREELFEDKKMLKLGRGARKGIDVALEDSKVARVHAVINFRKETDVHVMNMAPSGTFINGKKAGSRGKLTNGCEVQMGETFLTVYIGDEAQQERLITPVDDADVIVAEAAISAQGAASLDGSILPAGAPTDAHPVMGDGQIDALATDLSTLATPTFDADAASQTDGSMPVAHDGAPTTAPPPSSDPGAQGTPSSPGMAGASNPYGQGLYPGHYEPHETYGVLGPAPAPIPDAIPGPSVEMLLDIIQRMNQEVWAVYPNES